jgi:hypothetical protein
MLPIRQLNTALLLVNVDIRLRLAAIGSALDSLEPEIFTEGVQLFHDVGMDADCDVVPVLAVDVVGIPIVFLQLFFIGDPVQHTVKQFLDVLLVDPAPVQPRAPVLNEFLWSSNCVRLV